MFFVYIKANARCHEACFRCLKNTLMNRENFIIINQIGDWRLVIRCLNFQSENLSRALGVKNERNPEY